MTATLSSPTPAKTPAPERSDAWLRRLSLANLAANIGIVVTGGMVRLTDSGLGCPEWPQCTEKSYVTHAEAGIHGLIEFGNRTLTFLLAAVIIGVIIAAWRCSRESAPRQHGVLPWALGVFAGVMLQAAIGGITVLTGLNPWSVAVHFMVSMALIYASYQVCVRCGAIAVSRESAPRSMVWLGRWVVMVCLIALAVGTMVTASGPHSGDVAATRTGFDPAIVSQLHADAVFLLVGLVIALTVLVHVSTSSAQQRKSVHLLLGALIVQGSVGMVQYFTGLPVVLVALHLLGACLVWLAAVHARQTFSPLPLTAKA